MNQDVTLISPDVPRRNSSRFSALPPDLYEQVRRRVKLLALLSGLGFALQPLVILVIFAASTVLGELPRDFWDDVIFLPVQVGAVTLSATLWWRARNPNASAEGLLTLGLLYQVISCLIIGTLTYWSAYRQMEQLPRLTWIPAFVILFPLIMPGPPRRMLWGAISAGAMAPVSLALLDLTGRITTTADLFLSASLNSALAIVFAYAGARTVYGLGRKVVEARQMGSYELEERLGSGGMGEVWRARHRMLARPAAIKLIRPEILRGDDSSPSIALKRFELEAQATAGLRSPHTIELYDYGIAEDGSFYYVMELLDGLDAATLIQSFGPVSASRAVYLLQQVCRSLSEAHGRGLIHRDIKPANIFVCRYGEDLDFVKVLDFGLVKHATRDKESGDLTTEFAGGTPAFIAPEQALGRELDGRTDIYAVGCVAYWLLTGQFVFSGSSAMELITKHVHVTPTPVSEHDRTVPPQLEQTIMSCLEKDPDRRPASARELGTLLGQGTNGVRWTQNHARAWWDEHMAVTDRAGHDAPPPSQG